MTHVPLEASDIERFTPPSLANLENPPVFRLRAGTRRDRDAFERRLIEEGWTGHSTEAMRAETLNGLKAGWSEEDFDKFAPLVKAYWDAIDDWEKENDGKKAEEVEPFVFEHFSTEDMAALTLQVTEYWRPLRKMAADIHASRQGTPIAIVSVVVDGWSNLDVPFRREAGRISVEAAQDIKAALDTLQEAVHGSSGGNDDIPEGRAFGELFAASMRRLFLPKEAEKNSQSPSTSETIPLDTESGTALPNGTSKASEPSTETPANSSATETTPSSPSTTNVTGG